jgi:hypothetical protein
MCAVKKAKAVSAQKETKRGKAFSWKAVVLRSCASELDQRLIAVFCEGRSRIFRFRLRDEVCDRAAF